jgi:hypothetical protein
MFMTMGETVSQMHPLTGLLFIPQMIYEGGEPQWNDIARKTEEHLSQYHFVHHKSRMD